MKHIKLFEDIDFDHFDYEENEYGDVIKGNTKISENQLIELLNIIDKIVDKHNYSKYIPNELVMNSIFGLDGNDIVSQQIYIFNDNSRNATRIFSIEYLKNINIHGYIVNYYDKDRTIVENGNFILIKELIEKWL